MRLVLKEKESKQLKNPIILIPECKRWNSGGGECDVVDLWKNFNSMGI